MRHRDPHEDPPARPRPEPYRAPGNARPMRSLGCNPLLIYCSTGLCHHSATIEADRWPDDTAVRDLCRKVVCTKCRTCGRSGERAGRDTLEKLGRNCQTTRRLSHRWVEGVR
jgi:hypothetical protein